MKITTLFWWDVFKGWLKGLIGLCLLVVIGCGALSDLPRRQSVELFQELRDKGYLSQAAINERPQAEMFLEEKIRLYGQSACEE